MIRWADFGRTNPGNSVRMECSRTPKAFLCAFRGTEHRGPARLVLAGLLTAPSLAVIGCSTLHVPAVRPSFSMRESVQAETDGITLRASPIVGKESYNELFDDDLPQVGIIAVWVALENHSKQPVAVDPKRWYMLAASRRCPVMPSNEMMDRYYRERGIRLYIVQADERARDRLQKLSLQRGELAPGTSAEGFVFFRTDGSAPPSWNRDARLMAKGIKLGGKRKLDMELPLYAHP
jgi:hypothetical protein